jgi:hypothetical protein
MLVTNGVDNQVKKIFREEQLNFFIKAATTSRDIAPSPGEKK